MVLESVIVCLDNSEFSRNGDYFPTRLEAQKDAASILSTHRLESNPESTCGCIGMAGQGVEVLVSPTTDLGKYMAGIAELHSQGFCNLSSSIKIAQLALKHRQNKNGGQRIVLFVGSPVQESERELVRIGKQLKKNNVALDVVSFGELDENQAVLEQLVDAANSAENSHLLTVPSNTPITDVLRASSLLMDEGMMMMGGGGTTGTTGGGFSSSDGNPFEMYGGVNPELDPELAMALRVSAEEARAAEEAKNKEQSEQEGEQHGDGEQQEGGQQGGEQGSNEGGEEEMDEDELLRQALAMSMAEVSGGNQENSSTSGSGMMSGYGDDDDAALQMALQMSLQQEPVSSSSSSSSHEEETQQDTPTSSSSGGGGGGGGYVDSSFVNQLLGSIEGVDMSDPLLRSAIESVTGTPERPDQQNQENEEEDETNMQEEGGEEDESNGDASKK